MFVERAKRLAGFGKVSFLERLELLALEEREDRRLAAEPHFVSLRHAVQLAHPVVHLVELGDVRADLLGRHVRREEEVLGLVELRAGEDRDHFVDHLARFGERGGVLFVGFGIGPGYDVAGFEPGQPVGPFLFLALAGGRFALGPAGGGPGTERATFGSRCGRRSWSRNRRLCRCRRMPLRSESSAHAIARDRSSWQPRQRKRMSKRCDIGRMTPPKIRRPAESIAIRRYGQPERRRISTAPNTAPMQQHTSRGLRDDIASVVS